MTRLRVLSLGGGTQSCALALMSARGALPRLDAVIFADTQGELPATYRYLNYLQQHLNAASIPLYRVTAGSLYDDLMVTTPTASNPTPPVHVRNPDGTKGRIGQYRCSYDYKRRVIERTMKRLCGGRGAWKRSTVEQWIGFSGDEADRCRAANGCRCGHPSARHTGDGRACTAPRCRCDRFDAWLHNRWPLIELGFDREDTIAWFGEHGHPVPLRSACYFCPNSSDARWRALRDDEPELFDSACTLDETIRHGGGFNARGNQPFAGTMYLHESCEPLRLADIRSPRQRARDAGQGELFEVADIAEDCKAGVCFT